MMALSLFRNKMAYPCGVAPRFDSAHIAAAGCLLSAIPSGGGFLSLITGKAGTITGTPAIAGINGAMGVVYGGATSSWVDFAGSTTVPAGITLAGIVNQTTSSGYSNFIGTSNTNSGWRFGAVGTTLILTAGGVADVPSTIALALNTPYFVVVSANSVTANFVALNLLTGAVRSYVTSGSTSLAPSNVRIGSDAFNAYWKGSIGPVMASATFLEMSEILAWAADPWSFWYLEDSEYPLFYEMMVPAYAVSLSGRSMVRSFYSGGMTPRAQLSARSSGGAMGRPGLEITIGAMPEWLIVTNIITARNPLTSYESDEDE